MNLEGHERARMVYRGALAAKARQVVVFPHFIQDIADYTARLSAIAEVRVCGRTSLSLFYTLSHNLVTLS